MDLEIPIINLVLSLSSAIDLIDSSLTNHHKRVAYIAYSIAKEMDFQEQELKDLVLASLLHDCGAMNQSERNALFEFDYGSAGMTRHSHGYKGWFILHESSKLRASAEIIKFHHVFWEEESNGYLDAYNVPALSHVLHLADRIDILINRNKEILDQRTRIRDYVHNMKGSMFMPAAVEAFDNLYSRHYFWFDIVNPYLDELIKKELYSYKVKLNLLSLMEFSSIAHRMIDFRSKFTATHSIGVATSASSLAAKLGCTPEECGLMHCAGLMHDLGKLAVPESILEKNGPLDQHESNIIKSHTYHTYRIINSIPGLEKLRNWASFHHEKLDGSGYPFGHHANTLDLGSRILAISDMFTALTEDRPYRKAMSVSTAMNIIRNTSGLDYDVISCLNSNLDEINQVRKVSQETIFKSCNQILNNDYTFLTIPQKPCGHK